MKKRDFETYQKRFRDFEILPKFSETHVFRGTIRHPLNFHNCFRSFERDADAKIGPDLRLLSLGSKPKFRTSLARLNISENR